MTMVGHFRSQRYADRIQQRAKIYQTAYDEQARLSLQLNAWNEVWQRIKSNVPYFQKLCREKHLPAHFSSWQEFQDLMPVTTRTSLQQFEQEMIDVGKEPDLRRATGGSTAEPIRIPLWKSEDAYTIINAWLGRSWYGISPGSPLFMLWGHSHLLGSGVGGYINAQRRKLFDRLLGYYRFSAYDLQPSALRRAADELIRFKPEYLIGYSVALDLFARANFDRLEDLRALKLKAVIATGEAFPAPESESSLQRLFNSPVAMEYGAVETGVLAHTHPDGGYNVFWSSYFVEAEPSMIGNNSYKLRVTSLYPRSFPLVRYEIGDEITLLNPTAKYESGIAEFEKVLGRCNDFVAINNGTIVHSEAFTHAVRPCAGITGYQVVQVGDNINIHYTSSEEIHDDQLESIRVRLTKVHPELKSIGIKKVDRLQQTVAGKTRMIIKSESHRDGK